MTGAARPGWPTPWPEVDRAVERLRDGVAEAVGGDLVGLYLGGSLGLGDFDPASSDVDVLVATAGVLPGAAVERLRRLHGALHAEGGWAARLEVIYLPLATLRRFDPGTPPAGADRPDRPRRAAGRGPGQPGRGLGPGGQGRGLAAAPQLPGLRGPEHVPRPVRAGARDGGVQAGGGRLGERAAGPAVAGDDRPGPGLALRRPRRRPAPAGDVEFVAHAVRLAGVTG